MEAALDFSAQGARVIVGVHQFWQAEVVAHYDVLSRSVVISQHTIRKSHMV